MCKVDDGRDENGLCPGQCVTCPFAWNEESEYVQNLGCLPTPFDIVEMKKQSGHNWACHSDESKKCAGYVDHMKEHHPEIDTSTGKLISYDKWYREGPEAAMEQAGEHLEMADIINIDFRSPIPIETKLSNFNNYPFVFSGVECAGMEGLVQAFKIKDKKDQALMCTFSGRQAKKIGRELPDWKHDQLLHWRGLDYDRDGKAYYELVLSAYRAMAEQNLEFRELLVSTGERKLTHKVGSSKMTETVLTEREFCEILTTVRASYLHSSTMEF